MLQLLREESFSVDELNHPACGYAKIFQRLDMASICRQHAGRANFCEIGPHDYFNLLEEYSGPKYVIDPYADAGGAGLGFVPANLPYPVTLFRCLLGQDSSFIPDGFVDFSYSVSVIEHIGQAEAGYDCRPVDHPPEDQERPRRSFCQELFRITRPGGVTIHSVDHAARNLSFVRNFIEAGFVPLRPGESVTVDECLFDKAAIRQRHAWLDPTEPMSEQEMTLHSVLTMGFTRPHFQVS